MCKSYTAFVVSILALLAFLTSFNPMTRDFVENALAETNDDIQFSTIDRGVKLETTFLLDVDAILLWDTHNKSLIQSNEPDRILANLYSPNTIILVQDACLDAFMHARILNKNIYIQMTHSMDTSFYKCLCDSIHNRLKRVNQSTEEMMPLYMDLCFLFPVPDVVETIKNFLGYEDLSANWKHYTNISDLHEQFSENNYLVVPNKDFIFLESKMSYWTCSNLQYYYERTSPLRSTGWFTNIKSAILSFICNYISNLSIYNYNDDDMGKDNNNDILADDIPLSNLFHDVVDDTSERVNEFFCNHIPIPYFSNACKTSITISRHLFHTGLSFISFESPNKISSRVLRTPMINLTFIKDTNISLDEYDLDYLTINNKSMYGTSLTCYYWHFFMTTIIFMITLASFGFIKTCFIYPLIHIVYFSTSPSQGGFQFFLILIFGTVLAITILRETFMSSNGNH